MHQFYVGTEAYYAIKIPVQPMTGDDASAVDGIAGGGNE
jgi:hypothetical protein